MEKAVSFKDVAIVYIKGSAYRIHFWYISKDDAINIMNNSSLIDKMGVLEKNFFFFFHFINISEITDLTYYQRKKETLKKQTRDKYRNLSEEEKIKRENMGKIDTIICLKKRNKN